MHDTQDFKFSIQRECEFSESFQFRLSKSSLESFHWMYGIFSSNVRFLGDVCYRPTITLIFIHFHYVGNTIQGPCKLSYPCNRTNHRAWLHWGVCTSGRLKISCASEVLITFNGFCLNLGLFWLSPFYNVKLDLPPVFINIRLFHLHEGESQSIM